MMTLDNFAKITSKPAKAGIYTNCYYAILKKYKEKYPNALFRIVMRFPFEPEYNQATLSPSPKLLKKAKSGMIDFRKFAILFEKEIFTNRNAVNELRLLRDLSATTQIFLVCCEVNDKLCHRSLLKRYIEDLNFYLAKWNWRVEK
ncbi:DUF488 family protein, N3 subclade [Candidatus Harpocratesius sp.]